MGIGETFYESWYQKSLSRWLSQGNENQVKFTPEIAAHIQSLEERVENLEEALAKLLIE